jgi:hypothetical protein
MDISFIYYSVFIIILISLLYELSCEDCYNKKNSRYLKSSHSGLIRGVITGCILGNFDYISAVQQGAVFGVINPFMVHMGY